MPAAWFHLPSPAAQAGGQWLRSRCTCGPAQRGRVRRSRGGRKDPAAARPSHFPARAKHVIFLYMDGGPSQVDTFDPKPRLDREHGQPFKMKVQPTQFDNVGTTLKSPWKFRQAGSQRHRRERPVAAHRRLCRRVVRRAVDDVAILRAHQRQLFPAHGPRPAGTAQHGGVGDVWPGERVADLPGFVVLNGDLIPPGGVECFHNGFLPATFQGSVFRRGANPVADLAARERSASTQRRKLDLMRTLDAAGLERSGHNDAIEAAIRNYELAFRMQTAVPELMDVSRESKATQELYGMFDPYE